MKDVAIRPITPQDVETAARFISLVNTGEATMFPDLAGTRAEITQMATRIVESGLPAFTLRLYEGEGRICGFIALSPDNPSLLLGPLLHIGDWAGHADAMFRALINAVGPADYQTRSGTDTFSVHFFPANRNMHAFVLRHDGRVVSADSREYAERNSAAMPRTTSLMCGLIPFGR